MIFSITDVVTYEKTCKKNVGQMCKVQVWPAISMTLPKNTGSSVLLIYFFRYQKSGYGGGCNDNDGNGSGL